MPKTLDEMLWAIRDDRTLSKNAKLVWVMLLSRGEDCRPALRTIAADCGLARSTVFLAIQELDTAGWLKVSPNQTKVTPEQKYGVPETSSYYPICPGSEGVVRLSDYPLGETPRPEGGSPMAGLGDSPTVGPGSPTVGLKDKPSLETTSVKEKTTGTQSEPVAKRKRATRIPDDFAEQLRADTAAADWFRENCPDVDGKAALAEFIDYWKGPGGQRGTKLDWTATWRNRMRTLQERKAANRPSAAAEPGSDGWVQSVSPFRGMS